MRHVVSSRSSVCMPYNGTKERLTAFNDHCYHVKTFLVVVMPKRSSVLVMLGLAKFNHYGNKDSIDNMLQR